MGKTSRFGNILSIVAGAAASGFFICGGAAPRAYAAGYEFDGVGSRAVARGGAVIADAADWTAIYWNPAGLAGLSGREAGIDLRAGTLVSKDGNSFNMPAPATKFSKTKNSTSFVLGSGGGAVPLNERSALGFGVYAPVMQGVEFADTDAVGYFNSFKSKGYAAIGVGNVSYAARLGDRLSGGFGVNAIYAKLKSKSSSGLTALLLTVPDTESAELDGHGYGLEGVFGLKYRQSGALSFGAVFRTGAQFKIEGDARFSSLVLPDEKSGFALEFKHPATSGVGAAWKAGKGLTLTCDYTQTWWKGFSNKTIYDTPGAILKSNANTYDWSNSHKIRAGGVWNYDEKTDLLFGYAFDTPAIDARSVDFSTAIDVPMHRFSAAAARKFGALEATLGALAGGGARTAGGVHYSVSGWYIMSEARYKF